MRDIIKNYPNGEITVVWQPKKCIHSGVCFRGLPSVFNPAVRPWITMEGSTSGVIAEQVSRCPSGALSIQGNPGTTI